VKTKDCQIIADLNSAGIYLMKHSYFEIMKQFAKTQIKLEGIEDTVPNEEEALDVDMRELVGFIN